MERYDSLGQALPRFVVRLSAEDKGREDKMLLKRKSWMGLCLLLGTALVLRADLELTREGATAYVVVPPENPTPVDAYAVRVLTNTLHRMTGAAFPVVSGNAWMEQRGANVPLDAATERPQSGAIFVGLSAPARARLGEAEPLAGLAGEEHVARSQGADIFLYGQGARGNLYAVMDFLENSLGWRWFSHLAHPVTPRRPALDLAPFARRTAFDFPLRESTTFFETAFYYLQGINLSPSWSRSSDRWDNLVAGGIVPALNGEVFIGGCHTSFQYIPPRPDTHLWAPWQWVTNRNYFATNPHFFSLNPGGVRTPVQLCFGNRALRDTLTATVLEHIRRLGTNAVITVGAEDSGGAFCHCEACQKLSAQYASPAGAYFDYLLELCRLVEEPHPGVLIKGVAYRREQTQKPPTLPEGERFPENFILLFAAIDDPYLGDWNHPAPVMRETAEDLRRWTQLARQVWVFYYPTPYGTGRTMPVGNVQRLVGDLRLMHRLGVKGVFLEEAGSLQGVDFCELHPFLFAKLTRNIDADVDRLIEEFTDAQYGPAGALARTYLHELEQGRLDMTTMPRGMTYSSRTYDAAQWPYLTPANLRRWQGLFDEMEARTAALPTEIGNVRRLRRNLDLATLFKWLDLTEAHPDYFTDPAPYGARIRAVNASAPEGLAHAPRPIGDRAVAMFESVIRGGGEKPLPAEFGGIDRQRIRTFMPEMTANDKYHQGHFDDPDAAFGYAPSAHRPELPFHFGFYQGDTRVHGPRRTLERGEIEPGAYRLYALGSVTLTPQSQIWFSRSWSTKVVLDDLWEPGDPNRWEAYASIKFRGPMFCGEPVEGLRSGEVDLVLIDRVILVKHEAQE